MGLEEFVREQKSVGKMFALEDPFCAAKEDLVHPLGAPSPTKIEDVLMEGPFTTEFQCARDSKVGSHRLWMSALDVAFWGNQSFTA
ncbi:hypothetical protein PIB30_018243 [Stylosanthes scabra]|uniref:Uncharacterized protein n=1 Tax=Stylosanthes scabra TaxID=79078 RepID=A0ABU6V6V8_9FABA|nr:hypothetical protein [Stylosanthes scabra]